MSGQLTHHWVCAGLAVLVAGIALSGLGIAAYAIHVCASATALIDSSSEIRTTADAEREFAKWGKRLGKESWMESDDSGRGGNYYARIVNRAIARLHIVEPSEVTVRLTVRDGELLCVTVFISTPVAPGDSRMVQAGYAILVYVELHKGRGVYSQGTISFVSA